MDKRGAHPQNSVEQIPKVNSFTGERKEKPEREKVADLRTGDSGCQ